MNKVSHIFRINLVVAPIHLVSSRDSPLDRWRGGHWGMNTTSASATAYTPLECLLLFQSLVAFGTRDDDFLRISDLLANNALVKDGPTYDAQRLSADALRILYLHLLHEELKTEEQDGQDDGVQTGSRKRKLPSPPLPSFKDAQQYKDRLPLLVDRLYARYRDYMIHAIREDERRYAAVQKEIAEIERGEWDDRILKEDQGIANRNGSISIEDSQPPKTNGTHLQPLGSLQEPKPVEPEATKLQDAQRESVEGTTPQPEPAKRTPLAIPAKPSPPAGLASPRTETRPEGLAITDVLNSQQTPEPATVHANDQRPQNGIQNGSQPLRPPPIHQNIPQNAQSPHPQLAQQQKPPPNGSHVQQTPTHQQLPPQQGGNQWKWEPPYGPGHQPPQYQSGNNHPPPYNTPQYPQNYAPPHRGSFSSPHGLPPPHPHVPSSPSPLNTQHPHPILLPPPNGMGRSPSSPGMPLDALADIAGQQYRAPSGSPMMQQQPMIAPPAGYQQQQYPPPHRPPPTNGPQQWNQPQPFTSPGPYQHPPQPYQPFQPGPTQRLPFPPRPDLVAPENRQYNSPYNASQGPKPSSPLVSQKHTPKPRISQPNTPISQGLPSFRTGSGTRWTPNPTASTPRPNKVVPRPVMEPLSPVLRPAKPPATKKQTPKKEAQKGAQKGSSKGTPKGMWKDVQQENQQETRNKTQEEERTDSRMANTHSVQKEAPKEAQRSEISKVSKPLRRGPGRPRAGSTTSSTIAGSHRSPSVTSHADELSIEAEIAGRHVKQEVATPVGVEDAGDTTADEGNHLSQHHSTTDTPRQSIKRKRDASPAMESHPRPPSAPPTHVLWTRAFPKISASALESVSSHKNASTFAAPVKERDAPGYKHIILQPQDLKTIRSAINAGHRAASAAAPPNLGSQTSVMLPISEDLVPPKGIINNAQLEKELMRMFANAIMFNADPGRGFGRALSGLGKGKSGDVLGYEIDEDGVVKDTKSMFKDVEKIITDIRLAERRSEDLREASIAAGNTADDDEVDELAGDGDGSASNVGSVAKRRRKV
ncbi:hypothetical protein B0J14DRAFT_556266 [Halenospora varia]|nr:hypothetical protein B0J14DRAFT_556266 [Halenospora varia]